jgi:histidine triad (HIT) family protein
MPDCIFCKIAKQEIPKEFIYEDEDVMVFPDIRPVKPIHLLILPKKHIVDFSHVTDGKLMEKLWKTVQAMVTKEHLDGKGYKVSVNGGGAQEIDHLHIHLIGPLGKAVEI